MGIPTKKWILVANRGGAYFFSMKNKDAPILFQSISNPRGRLTNRELNSDRPGRTKDRFGSAKHSMMRSHSPKEQVAIDFAKEIARFLETSRSRGKFDKLLLIAPSKLLGELKVCLKPLTQKLIEKSFHKVLREDNMQAKLKKLLLGNEAMEVK